MFFLHFQALQKQLLATGEELKIERKASQEKDRRIAQTEQRLKQLEEIIKDQKDAMEKQDDEMKKQRNLNLDFVKELDKARGDQRELTEQLESAQQSILKAETGLEEQKALNKELQSEA
jgi:hypothetical protein